MHPPDLPGTYVIWMPSDSRSACRIGRLGTLPLQQGVYAYIGSARGPGGLAARLRHHLKRTTKPHWHIDYLRQQLPIHEIWYTCGTARLEHPWAKALDALPSNHPPMPGFGSSDCRCPSHLFCMAGWLSLEEGRAILSLEGGNEIQAFRPPAPVSNDRYERCDSDRQDK